MMTSRHLAVATALALALLLVTGIATARAADEAPPTPEELETQLCELAAKGKFTPALVDQFFTLADLRARDALVPATVSEEFWTWLSAHETARRALLLDGWPEYGREHGKVFQCLDTLRTEMPKEVERLEDLAIAFAMVHGRIGRRGLRAGWRRKAPPGGTPGVVESFTWYAENEKRLLYPVARLPWPVLVYVADNDLPLSERRWCMSYANTSPQKFGSIYYDVPYDMDGLTSASGHKGLKINKFDYTLTNLRQHGGVCADRAYYASRILKTLGVPAMYDAGMGARGAHAWVTWMAIQRGKLAMDFSGRWDNDKYFTGELYCPIAGGRRLDRDVELIAAAMNSGLESYVDATAACCVYDLAARRAEGKGPTDLLIEALKRRNAYSAPAWRLLGAAVADGTLDARQGQRIYDAMSKPFRGYPDLTYEMLEYVLAPMLEAGEESELREVKRNAALLDKAYAMYCRAERPDLAVKLRLLQTRYLEATGHADKALKLAVDASQEYAKQHFGFIDLFDRALALMEGDEHDALRFKFLGYMSATVPMYQSDTDRKSGDISPVYVHVVQAYAAALEAAGKSGEAAMWRAKAKGGA